MLPDHGIAVPGVTFLEKTYDPRIVTRDPVLDARKRSKTPISRYLRTKANVKVYANSVFLAVWLNLEIENSSAVYGIVPRHKGDFFLESALPSGSCPEKKGFPA